MHRLLEIEFPWGLPSMKLVIRIFALSIVIAGAAAAATMPKPASALVSHQSATGRMPSPACGGHMGCVANPTPND
jgi:hypothetical protein